MLWLSVPPVHGAGAAEGSVPLDMYLVMSVWSWESGPLLLFEVGMVAGAEGRAVHHELTGVCWDVPLHETDGAAHKADCHDR